MRIVVNTPTGKIGSALLGRLLGMDVELVLLNRNATKLKPFADRGAIVHEGDLEDAEFVVTATRGADALFWVTPADVATDDLRAYYNQLGKNAASAVTENGIPRVVDLSSIGAQHETGTGPIAGLYDIEKLLETTDAHVTHLRPAFFMENFFMSAGTIVAQGAMYLPCQGSTQLEMIATADIARAAADVILDDSWAGRNVLELAGPARVSFDEAAEVLGAALGSEVRHVPVSPEQTREALVGMGISEGVADSYLEMYRAFDNGFVTPEHPDGIKRMEMSFEEFAKNVFAPAVQSMKAE